jgi:AraC-like DNA-binding protein
MSTLELILRTIAATSALVLTVTLARMSHVAVLNRMFGVCLCLGATAYVSCSATAGVCTPPWLSPAMALAAAVPFSFWGWARSVMDDDFRLTPFACLGGAVLTGIPIVSTHFASEDWNSWSVTAHSLLGLVFVVGALASVLRGWRQDLIEARRRLRLFVLIAAGAYASTVLAVELALRSHPPIQELQLLNSFVLAALLLGLALIVLDVAPAVRAAFGWSPPPAPAPVRPADVDADDATGKILRRLEQLMTKEGAYRDPDLSIASLAARIGMPEKKLRGMINERLGYKNFPSYVNAFRLEEVRKRLGDSGHDRLPILTLALEAGFGSVVAFNRAFKDRYGTTPSAFRAQREPGKPEADAGHLGKAT